METLDGDSKNRVSHEVLNDQKDLETFEEVVKVAEIFYSVSPMSAKTFMVSVKGSIESSVNHFTS